MARRLLSLPSFLALLALVPACAQGGGGDDDGGQPRVDGRVTSPDGGRDAGRRIDAGRRDAGSSPDAGRDAGSPADAGPLPDGGGATADAGRDAGGSTTCTPSPTTIVISEVMVASQSGSGDFGEWFEIRNLGSCAIDLTGVVIESPTGAGTPVTHTVTSGLLTAGGLFVFAQSGDTAENHGLSTDYVYGSGTSGVVFNNSSDELILSYMGTEIDRVAWGSTDYRVGTARQLSRGSTADNIDLGGLEWCDATNVYSSATGGPFLGTPGALNATCP